MKKFRGSFPRRDDHEQKPGNSDCKFNVYGKEIIEVLGDYTHAIRVEDVMTELRPDHIYMYPVGGNVEVNIVKTLNVSFDTDIPDTYPELIKHMKPPAGECNMFGNINNLNVRQSASANDAVLIKVNDRKVGFYFPVLNSWIVGDWTWHLHYITKVLPYLFPKFIEELHIMPCKNSINTKKPVDVKPRIKCTVGADPEMELTRNNVVIRADTNLGIEDSLRSQIGYDGQSSILEFRPRPGTPGKVVQNIRKLVKEFAQRWPSYDLTDTGAKFPLGGHLHVGVDQEIQPPRQLVTLLDDFVGRATIELSGPARGGYKSMGNIRSQPHGFEYRTTPASVFQNPMITFIVLKLVKNLSEKFFNEEQIEYNDEPTDEDYIRVGGLLPSEVKKFREFCANYMPTTSIRKSWKVAPASETTRLLIPIVEFHDAWAVPVKESLLDAMMSGIQMEHEYKITFYGLAEDRCTASATIQMEHLNHYENIRPKWSSDRHLNVGISYDLRKYGISRSTISEMVQVIKAIIDARECQLNNGNNDDE